MDDKTSVGRKSLKKLKKEEDRIRNWKRQDHKPLSSRPEWHFIITWSHPGDIDSEI
jgi:hypothetical protein